MGSIGGTSTQSWKNWGDISQKKYQKDIWELGWPRKDVEGRMERKDYENVRRLEKEVFVGAISVV